MEMCFIESNKTADDAIRVVLDKYHRGVLYFKNAIRFQGTGVSVVSFTPLNMAFTATIFMEPTRVKQLRSTNPLPNFMEFRQTS
jgi:hypothetical protein